MRLRDAYAIGGAILAVCAFSGCDLVRGRDTAFKDDTKTPHNRSQTEIALAQQYIEDEKYEIALDRLQHAAALEPSSADAYTMLGFLYEKINRPAQAEVSYAKSVKLAPDKGDILNNYGAWLCRSGHPLEADPVFRKALADPFYKTPAAALGNAATCASKAGKPDLAEGYNRQILALDATNVDALQALATLQYQRGDFLRARGFIERLLATGKPTAETLDLAAQVEDKLGDRDRARSYRERLATEFPLYTPSQL